METEAGLLRIERHTDNWNMRIIQIELMSETIRFTKNRSITVIFEKTSSIILSFVILQSVFFLVEKELGATKSIKLLALTYEPIDLIWFTHHGSSVFTIQ